MPGAVRLASPIAKPRKLGMVPCSNEVLAGAVFLLVSLPSFDLQAVSSRLDSVSGQRPVPNPRHLAGTVALLRKDSYMRLRLLPVCVASGGLLLAGLLFPALAK